MSASIPLGWDFVLRAAAACEPRIARCIDISTAQDRAPIDWAAVREAGISAVWCKASQGIRPSQRRIEFLRRALYGAAEQGLEIGAYHYTEGRDLSDELDCYLVSVRGLPLTLRHVLDLEGQALDRLPTVRERRRYVRAWAGELPGSLLYGYRSALDDHDDWGLPLFVATRPWGHDEAPPSDTEILMRHQPAIRWAAWQYASRAGRCPGVTGSVDLGLYDPVQCRMTSTVRPLTRGGRSRRAPICGNTQAAARSSMAAQGRSISILPARRHWRR